MSDTRATKGSIENGAFDFLDERTGIAKALKNNLPNSLRRRTIWFLVRPE